MAKLHQYPVSVTWEGGRGGSGSVKALRSGVESTLAVPDEFGGTGKGTNPEDMLCGAVAACYSITFGIIADNQKIPYVNIVTEAEGEVEESGPQFTYKKVVIRPTITLKGDATDADQSKAEQMAHKADSYCIITNAIRNSVEIVVEPTIVRE